MNKKLIVAVDGSESSAGAVDFSIRMAKATGWDLVLLHVLKKSKLVEAIEKNAKALGRDWSTGAYLQSVLDKVLQVVAPRIWTSGIKYTTQIELGDHTAEKIVEYAMNKDAEMIIVGFRKSNIMESMTENGKFSRRVRELSPIPVVMVPMRSESIRERNAGLYAPAILEKPSARKYS